MRVWMRVVGVAVLAAMGLPAVAQEDGAAIYKDKCKVCHGADGQSQTFRGKMTGAESLTDAKTVQAPDAELVDVVTNGKKHMPGFAGKLTAEQIKAVVGYVRVLSPAAKPR